jgi:hypothetical protein
LILNVFSQKNDINSFLRKAIFPIELILENGVARNDSHSSLAEALLTCLILDLKVKFGEELEGISLWFDFFSMESSQCNNQRKKPRWSHFI